MSVEGKTFLNKYYINQQYSKTVSYASIIPMEETKTTPNPIPNMPPICKNLSLGAVAAIADRPINTNCVTYFDPGSHCKRYLRRCQLCTKRLSWSPVRRTKPLERRLLPLPRNAKPTLNVSWINFPFRKECYDKPFLFRSLQRKFPPKTKNCRKNYCH